MICPNCGDIVCATDTINTEWYDNKYFDFVEGICPNCDKMWSWTEVYVFDYDNDIREINENNHL